MVDAVPDALELVGRTERLAGIEEALHRAERVERAAAERRMRFDRKIDDRLWFAEPTEHVLELSNDAGSVTPRHSAQPDRVAIAQRRRVQRAEPRERLQPIGEPVDFLPLEGDGGLRGGG